MTCSQSEAIANTIIAAVVPQVTKADLESMTEHVATKADFAAIDARIESAKLWLSSSLLDIALSIPVLAFSLNS